MDVRYLFGIGMVLAVLMVFTATAAAENTAYFDPVHSNATMGNTTYVTLYLDIDEGIHFAGGQVQLNFDPTHADIIDCRKASPPVPTGPNQYSWEAFDANFNSVDNGYMWGAIVTGPQVSVYDDYWETWSWETVSYLEGPATVPIGRYKVEAVGTPGESPFDFGFEHFPSGCPLCQKTKFMDEGAIELDITWVDGTFTHLAGASDPFSMFLPEGWNLISLPLTPTDNSTSAVLGNATIVYDAVKSYNAATHQFEDATTMDPGIGYFVHVTTEGDWVYEGTAYTSMTASLSQGLNCVGWTNETGSALSGALSSIDDSYRYVARWNATSQSYEVYLPGAPAVFNDFATMDRGEGYFIAATGGCTLTYP